MYILITSEIHLNILLASLIIRPINLLFLPFQVLQRALTLSLNRRNVLSQWYASIFDGLKAMIAPEKNLNRTPNTPHLPAQQPKDCQTSSTHVEAVLNYTSAIP